MFLEQRIPAVVDSSQGADGGGGIEDDDFEVRFSKFHFVDLAGSERAKRTRAEGQVRINITRVAQRRYYGK